MKIDLSKLSASQAEALEVRARARLVILTQERKAALKESVLALLRKEGVSLAEVFPAKATKRETASKLPIQYQHPSDPSLQWSGHARRPRWFLEALAKGFTEAQMKDAAHDRTRAPAARASTRAAVKTQAPGGKRRARH